METIFETYASNPASLYVPTGSSSKYQAIEGWNTLTGGIYEGEPQEAVVDGIKYFYSDGSGVAKVIAGDYSGLENVTIKGSVTINGSAYDVTEVSSSAFRDLQNLKALVIEDGIQTIGRSAFEQCHNLSSIQFPSTLKSIGISAFESCGQPDIVLNDGLETIGDRAFAWCGTKKVTLPSSLKSIGQGAFSSMNQAAMVISHIEEPFDIEQDVFAQNWYWNDGNKIITYKIFVSFQGQLLRA